MLSVMEKMQEVTFDFSGKNFVVVGGSSGMGREIVLEIAKAGANVLAIARHEERLREVQNFYRDRIEMACLDVLDASDADWDKTIRVFTEKCGKLHGAVYSAGITGCTPLRMYDKSLARDIMNISMGG